MASKFDKVWALTRIILGWIFFWAFIDKVFGLGYATCLDTKTGKFLGVMCEKGTWLSGGDPTFGYLKFGTKGPLAEIFQAMAGNPIVTWLFMIGLLVIGASLMLGILVRWASIFGIVMVSLMYLSMLWPANNPFIDEHVLYAIIMLGFIFNNPGKTFGLGNWWANTSIVKKCPSLQ